MFIKPEKMSIETFAKQLEKQLDVILIAKKAGSEVNGYFKTKQEGEKTVVEVILYKEDEPANYFEGVCGNKPYNHGHKSSFKKLSKVKADSVKNHHDIISV